MPSQTLEQIVEGRRSQPNQLIEVLQDIQENYEYVSEDAMRFVSAGLGVPQMEVYRVASFYKAFRLKPAGKNVLTLCMGTACHVRGASKVLAELESQLGIKAGETTDDLEYTLETVACIGACALAPTMTIDNETYGKMTVNRVAEVLGERDKAEQQ